MALCSCITGIVIDENTGNPRGGLRVRVVADNGFFGGVPLIEGRTDQDGRFPLPTEMRTDTAKGTGCV